MSVRPIFLLSLPRSGSTLVQRVIGAHPEVGTVSEPWLLLPQLYAMRENGARAEYGHVMGAQALQDFGVALPGGTETYDRELRSFALRLYEEASGGAPYFLDKTPRYHLIAEQLPELFPEAKFIFLWRNPFGVLGSLLESFRGGRWEPADFEIDLCAGVANLSAARRTQTETSVAVRYEDLISRGAPAWRPLFDHLGLDFNPSLLSDFTRVELQGRLGDPFGSRDYPEISTQPREKWKDAFRGTVRKRWCRHYLARIGGEDLATMGYDGDELRREIDGLPSWPWLSISDMFEHGRSRRRAAALRRALAVPEGPPALRSG